MNAILSWLFLILSPVSLFVTTYMVYKKHNGKTLNKLIIGIVSGAFVAFIMYFISALIGMNFY